jgi:hypothetical protein
MAPGEVASLGGALPPALGAQGSRLTNAVTTRPLESTSKPNRISRPVWAAESDAEV